MALKRNEALQDYSREHHDELLLVWKIREGLKRNVAAKRIIDYCLYHYQEMLSHHMNKEEKYILTKLSEEDADRIKILNDHSQIRKMVEALSKYPEDIQELLTQFANELEQHIRFEERIFFPRLQAELSVEMINSMQPKEKQLEDCNVWSDVFWENKK